MAKDLYTREVEISIERKIQERIGDGSVLSRSEFPYQTPPDEGTGTETTGTNYIDNSEFDYSKDDYLNNPAVGGDDAAECYNFFRQRMIRVDDAVFTASSTTVTAASAPFKSAYTYPMPFFALGAGVSEATLVGTITRVSDTEATLSVQSEENIGAGDTELWFGETVEETDAKSLKMDAHSLWTGVEDTNLDIPRWDSDIGHVEIGSASGDNWSIITKLPLNLASPGLPIFFSTNAKLRSGATHSTPIRLFAGIYDTTSGQQKFLEGGNFDLTVNVVGTAGSTTYECMVVATFPTGTQVASDIVTVSSALSSFDADNYLEWGWDNAPTVQEFALYRKNTGTGDVVRVFTIYNGETQYFDKNVSGENTETALPTLDIRATRAYVESPLFTPTTSWVRVPLEFTVPPTYVFSNTTASQVLVVGLVHDNLDTERAVILDRFMLSLQSGGWTRSARDLALAANQSPTSGNPDGTQGGTGTCFREDTPVFVLIDNKWKEVQLKDVKAGMKISTGNLEHFDRVTDVIRSSASKMFYVELENGFWWECTPTERMVTSRSDKNGTLITHLTSGDEILCSSGGKMESSRIKIKQLVIHEEPQPIITLTLLNGHIFVVGNRLLTKWQKLLKFLGLLTKWQKLLKFLGFSVYNEIVCGAIAHNRKPIEQELLP